MNTYCNIYELKPEQVAAYVELHEHCPDWQVQALRDAGADDLEIYLWGHYCIITYVCSVDFAQFVDNLSRSEDNSRWQQLVNGMFAQTPVIEGAALKPLDKIFSLREQVIASADGDV